MAVAAPAVAEAAAAAAEAAINMTNWRFGIGWRPQLSAGIFANLHRIDVVEVIADDYFHAAPHATGALRTLSSHVPLQLHGISMGMASTTPIDTAHLDAMARLIEQVRPEMWSEHLAFVRGGGIEIGHLAMPPRNDATVKPRPRKHPSRHAPHRPCAGHGEYRHAARTARQYHEGGGLAGRHHSRDARRPAARPA